MNDEQFKARWNDIKGSVREHLGKLTDDDVEQVGGHRDQMLAKIQQRYGDSKEAAEQKLAELEHRFRSG